MKNVESPRLEAKNIIETIKKSITPSKGILKQRAEELNKNLEKGDRVIFIKDIPEQYVAKGLLAQIVEKTNNDNELTVCPVFSNLTLSEKN